MAHFSSLTTGADGGRVQRIQRLCKELRLQEYDLSHLSRPTKIGDGHKADVYGVADISRSTPALRADDTWRYALKRLRPNWEDEALRDEDVWERTFFVSLLRTDGILECPLIVCSTSNASAKFGETSAQAAVRTFCHSWELVTRFKGVISPSSFPLATTSLPQT